MYLNNPSSKKLLNLVQRLQSGLISPTSVNECILTISNTISNSDIKKLIENKLPKKQLNAILQFLKATRKNINESSTQINLEDLSTDNASSKEPIVKTFNQKGNFDEYTQRFSGLELKPKEMESIINHTNKKPTRQDKYHIRYESTDDFGNNTITVIKKLREGTNLVFTVFQSNTPSNSDDKTKSESEIVVKKSISFRDEIEGGKILSDILSKLEI